MGWKFTIYLEKKRNTVLVLDIVNHCLVAALLALTDRNSWLIRNGQSSTFQGGTIDLCASRLFSGETEESVEHQE